MNSNNDGSGVMLIFNKLINIMRTKDYAGIARTLDTQVFELLPKLRNLTLEGVDDDGNLIWSGHQDAYAQADYETFYYQEHGEFPVERDDYDQVAKDTN